MTDRRDITLQIGDSDFIFCLAPQDVTKYFNAVTPSNKVAPSNNLLTTTVKSEQLAALRPLLGNPVLTMQIAGALLEDYSPDIEVIVKKALDRAERLNDDGLGQLLALGERWLPGADPSWNNLGTAKWLEDEYWRRMEIAVANGIAKAFGG